MDNAVFKIHTSPLEPTNLLNSAGEVELGFSQILPKLTVTTEGIEKCPQFVPTHLFVPFGHLPDGALNLVPFKDGVDELGVDALPVPVQERLEVLEFAVEIVALLYRLFQGRLLLLGIA